MCNYMHVSDNTRSSVMFASLLVQWGHVASLLAHTAVIADL